ncbi:MAG: phosphate ABC transporter ATP-binding protein, partial [Acidobacteriaceae bacterium]|nr:phosphate ABC transporter ATP-binding protein [Acidobacteriaceae bacterium]
MSPPATTPPQKTAASAKLQSRNLNFYYGSFKALHDISIDIPPHKVTAFIGPSGCGKSTFLRTMNRMNETLRNTRVEGDLRLDGANLLEMDVTYLRRRVGMVFQKSNPFPKSIFDNVAYGLRVNGIKKKSVVEEAVERSLTHAALWQEVKDKLNKPATALSGGQQQRLCIARALAVEPEVLLLDEPCSALDPIATLKIEELLFELKKLTTIVIVTHNMQQAARLADYTGFFFLGKLIEFDETKVMF